MDITPRRRRPQTEKLSPAQKGASFVTADSAKIHPTGTQTGTPKSEQRAAPNPIANPIEPNHKKGASLRSRVLRFVRKQPPMWRLGVVSGVSLGILVGGIAFLQMYGPETNVPQPDAIPEIKRTYVAPPTTVPSTLSGVQVDPVLNERPITAVMIENSIDARPQAGLSEAGVVFEAIAEGGITRFLALYQTEQPEHIGPVRSARPYYVRWAAGFDASYVHSGGSPEGLDLIRSLGVNDMDHGNHPGFFERVSNRYAPHNVYTSMGQLDALRESLGFTESPSSGFARIDQTTETQSQIPATTINFDISSERYNTSYTYNAETNRYARSMAGTPHVDERSGDQIQPSVIVALETTYGIHPNGIHSVYGIVGQGDVTVFQNGAVQTGTWSKPTDSAELSFQNAAGEPLLLQPGQTWITAIHNDRYSYSE